MATRRILVVDDDASVLEAVSELLGAEGYEVVRAVDGAGALAQYEAYPPDLVLLDVLMPGISGLEVCQRLRARDAATPIIMLTAKAEESDRVLGLDMGADDYVTKPFGARELVARVAAALRRGELVAAGPEPVSSGDLEIDPGRHRVCLRGETVSLTAREYDLLLFLVRRPGRVASREELLRTVWGYGPDVLLDTRTVDNHVLRLRHKLERDLAHPEHLVTVRGGGYMWEE